MVDGMANSCKLIALLPVVILNLLAVENATNLVGKQATVSSVGTIISYCEMRERSPYQAIDDCIKHAAGASVTRDSLEWLMRRIGSADPRCYAAVLLYATKIELTQSTEIFIQALLYLKEHDIRATAWHPAGNKWENSKLAELCLQCASNRLGKQFEHSDEFLDWASNNGFKVEPIDLADRYLKYYVDSLREGK